ncbi:MAG: hypothetical protein H7096_03015 [Flavobacterium sp.]|nr:hypothetical protein [Pedobacter sp.]
MSVLITAASHSAAYKLEKLLNQVDVFFADFMDLPKLSGKKYFKIPKGNSASFAHEMLNLALNEGIEKIFPLYPEEITALAEARQLFLEYGISVIVPDVNRLKEIRKLPLSPDGFLVAYESGKQLTTKLPEGLLLNDQRLTGIFKIRMENKNTIINIFTV